MFLQNGFKFDRFGEEMENENFQNENFQNANDLIDARIDVLKSQFANNVGNMFSQIEDKLGAKLVGLVAENTNIKSRLDGIEAIGTMYSVTKNYFSAKDRRIVSVKPAKDSGDAVIKKQLDDAVKTLNKTIKDLNTIYVSTENYKKWKEHVNETLQELLEKHDSQKTEIKEARDKIALATQMQLNADSAQADMSRKIASLTQLVTGLPPT